MKREVARQMAEAAPALVRLIENYSGRGMMGEMTAALEVSDLITFATAVGITVSDMQRMGRDVPEFLKAIQRVRTDNLGYDAVVY